MSVNVGDSGAPGRVVAVPTLVEINDVLVMRGDRPVLTIDHLAVAERETLSVVGPNGAGKSTLLLTLASLVHPNRGSLVFRGSPVGARQELSYRRHLGLVLADPLLLDASVFANVAAGLRFRGVRSSEIRARVTEWLERLGVGHIANRPARHISSGEAQRVSLARALVLDPELLLLDEPFASVDAATRARLLDDLEALLRQTHVACVIVTHDLDEAVRLGDRMAVVIEGRLRQCDAPEKVLSAPIDEDVAAFVGADTRMPGRVVSSSEGIVIVSVGQGHIEAASAAASAVEPGRAVLCCLRPEDVTLWSVGGPGADPDAVASASRDGAAGGRDGPSVRFASSARNQLTGRVRRIVPQGPLARVTIDCGVTLVAAITRTSAMDMGLVEGGEVVATFKATAVHLIPLAG